jgi:hypothetical protein
MATFQISINPLAEYLEATEARRKAIIKEQLNPPTNKTFHYQLAKSRIKKSVALSGDLKPVTFGIEELKKRKPEKDRQKSDIINSIIALERYAKMPLHRLILENSLEIIPVKQKYIIFQDISVTISPEVIFRINIDGAKQIGACKLHVSKGKPFSTKQSKLVAAFIELYLSNCVADEGEEVNPVLCFCLDTFAGTIINSNNKISLDMAVVKKLCEEIKQSIAEEGDSESVA